MPRLLPCRALSRTFHRGYNTALRAVRRSVAGMLASGELTADQRQTLATVTAQCRALRQRTRCTPRLATFAAQYAVSLRTVKNWKREGCPFAEGHRAVLGWMFRRRSLPAGPRRKFAREFQDMAVADAMEAVKRAKAEIGGRRDLPALATLAERMRRVFQALEPMDGEYVLRKSRELLSLTKTAVRYGLWE